VPKSEVDAYMWILIASGQGNDDAQGNISRLERRGMTAEQRAAGQKRANEFKPKKTVVPPDSVPMR
jgi:hypothetical protein